MKAMASLSSLPSQKDKVYLVTGGNTGIGYATCLVLVSKGARVYLGARSEEKATEAIGKIREKHPDADVHFLSIDHTALDTVVAAAKTFASKENQLHGLILNAGVAATSYECTKNGFEINMQVNYIAHWLLTYHLLPVLLSTARSSVPGSVRIVCVSSDAHRQFGTKEILYDGEEVKKAGNFGRYSLSKLANVLHAKTLNDEYGPHSPNAKDGKEEIRTASLHPGVYNTQMNLILKETLAWPLQWLYSLVIFLGILKPADDR
jgi:NAD(P)-dependent dehydrogenase (short-subunit alcohol dehydrogenase family)